MPASRKVLFISPQPFFAWRGSPIRVKFNLLALENLGYDVDLLTLPIGEPEKSVNARIIRVWNVFGSRQISIGPSPLKLWFDLLLLIKGTQLVLSNSYEVIHGTEEAGFISWILSKLCKAKVIYEKHSDPGSHKKGVLINLLLSVYRRVENFTARKADVVIGTGPGLVDQIKAADPAANAHHISDIPSSLSDPGHQEIEERSCELKSKDSEVLITYVGSFASYQGMDIIEEAIPIVLRESAISQFLIIGGNEQEIDQFKQTLLGAGINEEQLKKVNFAGKIPPDELPAYLSASDVLMVPRKTGINTPLKVLDYFKAGSAIVATDTIANRLLLDEDTAELSQTTGADFARCILSLVENEERRTTLGKNGRKMFETEYNFDVFSEKLGDAYRTIFPE